MMTSMLHKPTKLNKIYQKNKNKKIMTMTLYRVIKIIMKKIFSLLKRDSEHN